MTTTDYRACSLCAWRRRLKDERAEAEPYRSLAGRREGKDCGILLSIGQADRPARRAPGATARR